MNERQNPMGCPDAEMLAAWSDGGLRADEQLGVEEHASSCARCQAHLAALARTAAVEQPAASHTKVSRVWPWLVPTAGAAAAVTVWLMVQQPPPLPEPRQEGQVARDEADAPAPSIRTQRAPERKLEAPAETRRDRQVSPKPSGGREAANTAPATAAPAAPAAVLQERVAMSAAARAEDALIGRLTVHRSPEGRVTWEASEGISAQLTAGASPSESVIWLVGKGGLVLLSTDARSWRRLPFPEPVDLSGIEASSDAAATVTTADARIFITSDGGVTWQRK